MTKNNDVVVNEAMVSENNSKKLLRIFESDGAKMFASFAGIFLGIAIPGVLGSLAIGASIFASLYYGTKLLFRVKRVSNEDQALSRLEDKSPAVAENEAKRQNNLLNNLKQASYNLIKPQKNKAKKASTEKLEDGPKFRAPSEEQRDMT